MYHFLLAIIIVLLHYNNEMHGTIHIYRDNEIWEVYYYEQ